MTEAGQSATGALLDHSLRWHAAGGEPRPPCTPRSPPASTQLRAEEGPDLAPRLHVLPDFHGNRSPLADPQALGVISGLDARCLLRQPLPALLAQRVAIALGVRHILETLRARRLWPSTRST